MKRNAEESPVIEGGDNPVLQVVQALRQGGGARTIVLPSVTRPRQARPEIAVLGWEARSYRLSLRQGKA